MIEDAQRILAESEREAKCDVLSAKEFAALFDVTLRSVYKAIKAGKLPYDVVRPLGGAPRILVPRELVSRLRAA